MSRLLSRSVQTGCRISVTRKTEDLRINGSRGVQIHTQSSLLANARSKQNGNRPRFKTYACYPNSIYDRREAVKMCKHARVRVCAYAYHRSFLRLSRPRTRLFPHTFAHLSHRSAFLFLSIISLCKRGIFSIRQKRIITELNKILDRYNIEKVILSKLEVCQSWIFDIFDYRKSFFFVAHLQYVYIHTHTYRFKEGSPNKTQNPNETSQDAVVVRMVIHKAVILIVISNRISRRHT